MVVPCALTADVPGSKLRPLIELLIIRRKRGMNVSAHACDFWDEVFTCILIFWKYIIFKIGNGGRKIPPQGLEMTPGSFQHTLRLSFAVHSLVR